MMAPSLPKSTNALFPLLQSSPVRALLNFLDAAKSVEMESVNLMERLTMSDGEEAGSPESAIAQLVGSLLH
jgi:hypothetical protein